MDKTNILAATKEINTLVNEWNEQCKVMMKKWQDIFTEKVSCVFELDERINSISWTQYTPYFMDGEECTFSANLDNLSINGFDRYGDNNDNNDNYDEDIDKSVVRYNFWDHYKKKTWTNIGEVENPNYDENISDMLKTIIDFMTAFPEDLYEEIFGDHVSVLITRDGKTELNEYEHD